jgi:hypothetical protein
MRARVLLSLLVFCCSAAPSAACTLPARAHVVARTQSAWVAWRPGQRAPGTDQESVKVWSACLRGHRSVRLATTSYSAYGHADFLYPRLVGRYVAFVSSVRDHYWGGTGIIKRMDLARRRALFDIVGGDHGEFGESAGVTDLRMDARASVTWLEQGPGATMRIFVIDFAGKRTLDQDTDRLRHLRVRGRSIRWQHGNAIRRSRFARSPAYCPLQPDMRVLARSADAWVATAPGRLVVGCLRGHRRMMITHGDDAEYFTVGRHVRGAIVRGAYVGLLVENQIDTAFRKDHLIERADLATHTRLPQVTAYRRVAADDYSVGVTSFDMNQAGDVAWIVDANGTHQLVALDRVGQRTLDDAPRPSVISALHVDGASISWTHDGAARTGTFSP